MDILYRGTVDLPPSCVAFSPTHHDVLVIGTYHLEKDEPAEQAASATTPQKRSGSLIVYKVESDSLVQHAKIPTASAILDIAFSPHDPSLLAAATSTGSILLFRLSVSSATLHPISTLQVCPEDILVLDLVFHPTTPLLLGITLSSGAVALASVSPTHDAAAPTPLTTRPLEAWTLAFSPCGHHLYSGADDASLTHTPLSPSSSLSTTDTTAHSAGVTSILPLLASATQHVLLTGSYDDRLRAVRLVPGRPRAEVLLDAELGGGVWRLRLLRETVGEWVVLASCMHAGAKVLRVRSGRGDGAWSAEVLAANEEHESMNYGSDGVLGEGGRAVVVSSSFYDGLVCLWGVDVGREGGEVA